MLGLRLLAPFHIKLAVTIHLVACMPGWDLVTWGVLGKLAWLAALLEKEMPAAGCTSAMPAATSGNEGGEEFSLPPRRAATWDPAVAFTQVAAEGGCRHVSRLPGKSFRHHVGRPSDVTDIQCKFCHRTAACTGGHPACNGNAWFLSYRQTVPCQKQYFCWAASSFFEKKPRNLSCQEAPVGGYH
jgi:hypothetical protein